MRFARGWARAIACLFWAVGIVQSASVHAADLGKVLRVAQSDIDTLAPQEWTDYYSNWVGVAIFEVSMNGTILPVPRACSPIRRPGCRKSLMMA